jgi:hypothetical protein
VCVCAPRRVCVLQGGLAGTGIMAGIYCSLGVLLVNPVSILCDGIDQMATGGAGCGGGYICWSAGTDCCLLVCPTSAWSLCAAPLPGDLARVSVCFGLLCTLVVVPFTVCQSVVTFCGHPIVVDMLFCFVCCFHCSLFSLFSLS